MVSIGRLPGVCVLLLTFFWIGLDAPRAQPRRPNILLIVADDLGYADLGVHGSRDIRTPNIDRLAAGGIRFTDAYVTGPYCSPTRAALLTGRYQQRFGHEFNGGGGSGTPAGLPLSERTLADRLKAAGYETALFGKWHLGAGPGQHPMDRGFDRFFGFLGGAHSYLEVGAATANPILDGRSPAAGVTYLTDMLTDRAVSFLDRERAQPFFLYLAYNAVHTPMHATEPYLARFAHIADEERRTYAAMLAAMDDGIGRVMAMLQKRQLEEDTLVFFFSDNGGPTMPGTTINGASNVPLRGSKRQTYEGGIRVPFVVHWKGRLGGNRIDRRPVIQLDVFPTVLAAAGIAVDPNWKLDGVNLLPFLTTDAAARPHDVLYWRLGGTMAIRKGDWKLVKTAEGALPPNLSRLNDLSDAELFDLAADIGETKNLAASRPDVAKDLASTWQRWNRELAAPLWGPGPGGRGGEPPPAPAVPAREFTRTIADALPPLARASSAAGSWPSFRGARATGHQEGMNLPDRWNGITGDNIRWRTPIPGLAHSSPVVWGDRIFVTSAISSRGPATFLTGFTGEGTASDDRSPHRWVVIALDKRTGRILWERTAHDGVPRERRHAKSTYASATPATDGRIVVAFFGSHGLFAYDVEGRFRWKVDLGRLDLGAYDVPTVEWGTASSPVIWNDLVILQCDTQADSFVAAFDAATGRTVWKTARDEQPSWGTPTVVATSAGEQLVTNASAFIRGYDPRTGTERWRLGRSSDITVPTPFAADDLIVVASGRAPARPIFVIRPGARGDITPLADATSGRHVVWSRPGRGPYMPTPIASDGILYVLDNIGILDTFDLATGAEVSRQRLPDTASPFMASPVAADGQLYLANEDGAMFVLTGGRPPRHLATNPMGEPVMATPALSDRVMYVRGAAHLFAVGR